MRIYGVVLAATGRSIRVHAPLIARDKRKPVVLNGYMDGAVYFKCGEYCPIYYEPTKPHVSRSVLITPAKRGYSEPRINAGQPFRRRWS